MARVHLIHWHEQEATERAARIARAGHRATAWWGTGGAAFRGVVADPPEVVVIDLGRLPSHGRHTAVALREKRATRSIPIVFVDGAAEKVEHVRAAFPDALFTTWRDIASALRNALARPAAAPVVPVARAGYSGTPLPKKLGIRAGASLALLGAPRGFEATLGALPADVTVGTVARGEKDVIVLFCKARRELERRLPACVDCLAEAGGLWLAWPKQNSGVATDLGESAVRELGLATGLVDNKVCAIDATWSGLRFVRRKADRAGAPRAVRAGTPPARRSKRR